MPVALATCLIIFSLYIYLKESGYSQPRVTPSQESSFFSLSSVRRFFTTPLTVPENVRTRGTPNYTDGCRRLWLAGQSLWFDFKFNGSLSPVWTRHNKKLTPVISSWWKVGHFFLYKSNFFLFSRVSWGVLSAEQGHQSMVWNSSMVDLCARILEQGAIIFFLNISSFVVQFQRSYPSCFKHYYSWSLITLAGDLWTLKFCNIVLLT